MTKAEPTRREDGGCGCQLLFDAIIRKEALDGELLSRAVDFRLFAEEREARHRHEDGLDVDAPRVDEEHHLRGQTISRVTFLGISRRSESPQQSNLQSQ